MTRSEVQSRTRFDLVRYANTWEDADILVEALAPGNRHCLSIGSAGDNSFSLLAAGAASVTAVEMNPTQVACIELRKAAYHRLDHAGFLALLGHRECPDRSALYQQCSPDLSASSRDYWDSQPETIAAGFATVGKFESYFRIFRTRVLPLAHSKRRVARLLEPKEATERARFYDDEWNTWRWRAVFHLFFSRQVMGMLGRSPAFFKYVEGSVADRILERTEHALRELDPSCNPYLHYILSGSYPDHALPHALRPENFERIRSRLDDFHIVNAPIEQILTTSDQPFDAFNLSDIFEYMSEENYHALLAQLVANSSPDARLAYWNMLAPRSRPESMAGQLVPLTELAQRLHLEDKAFFYSRFVVESVTGD
ncbi:DUF3419 family protein [Sulfuriroseicoccus oceanibius]|uniref:DUF3419 family protein n=1 Tax=Sulfuriroseicoccus oceanibius TaxID=2707525 RepID=A0A6B3L202_9BACT|nr:DUF3419 family protein [Sulfuriroseicoccus oceanibius]QQL44246.1 DUF3419 family protein [Sulfuriroseicoccus oceanibius]